MIILAYILFTIFILQVFSELLVLFFPLRYHLQVPDHWPKVSILLVVRNEEANLESCVNSLLDQDYPDFEILIANDRSEDRTGYILESFASDARVFVLGKTLDIETGKNPKAMYLHELTVESSGKIIAVTDGDCVYPSRWLKSMVAYKSENGMVSGVTGVAESRMEDLEWKTNIGRIAVLAGMGFNTSGVGNNMIVEKQQLEEVGGWNAVANHLTEDFALHRLLYKKGISTNILFIPETRVTSTSTPFLKRFNQRKRWMSGVKGLQWVTQFMVLLQSFILPAMVLGVIYFGYTAWLAIFIYFILKLTSNFRLLLRISDGNFVALFPYQFYQLFWNFSFLIYHVFTSKFNWKARKY